MVERSEGHTGLYFVLYHHVRRIHTSIVVAQVYLLKVTGVPEETV